MTRSNDNPFSNLVAFLTAVSAALLAVPAWAMPVGPTESTSLIYTLDNGSRGAGTDALSETGFQPHGAFGFPDTYLAPHRYFAGESSESQQAGNFDIAYKNDNSGSGGVEYISHVFPSGGPTTSTSYFGGGSFDGTALWFTTSRFDSGGAPAIGSHSPPTAGSSPVATAGTGADIRRPDASLTLVDVIDGQVETRSFLIEADVFIPNHGALNRLRNGSYVDRQGAGLATPGGQAMNNVTYAPDQWNQLQVRVDITTDGGASVGSSDDSGSMFQTFFLNGTQISTRSDTLNATQMSTRTGPVRFSPSFGLQRGWQGDGSEAFIDNLTLSEIEIIAQLTTTPPDGGDVDFGLVKVDTSKTLADAVTLENTGFTDSEIDVTGFTITGPDADLFSLLSFSPVTLVAGGADSVSYDLQFDAPLVIGSFGALLTISTSEGDVELNLLATSFVPEPSAGLLLALGLVGMNVLRRKRRASAQG